MNDVERLASRYRDPSSKTAYREIDALTPGQASATLGAYVQDLAVILQVPAERGRKQEVAVRALHQIGPAAVAIVPILGKLLDRSSTKENYFSPSFCDLTSLLRVIGPSEKETGRALGANLLRAQRDTPTGVCYFCDCSLREIALTKGAASEMAGPYIRQFMLGKNTSITYPKALTNALAATGLKGAESIILLRLKDPNVDPDQKADLIRQLASQLRKMKESDQRRFYVILREMISDKNDSMRAEATFAISLWGKTSLSILVAGLKDPQVKVRRAAALGLSNLGSAATQALDPLIIALDPILGTAQQSASTLVAIGGPQTSSAIRIRAPKIQPWATYYADVAAAVEAKSISKVNTALKNSFTSTRETLPSLLNKETTESFLLISEGSGKGPAFVQGFHRLKVTFRALKYKSSSEQEFSASGSLKTYRQPGSFWDHLDGVRAGQKLKLFLSPLLATHPHYGQSGLNHHPDFPVFIPALYEISVEDVCQPKVWTLWKGTGIFGPVEFEVWCKG